MRLLTAGLRERMKMQLFLVGVPERVHVSYKYYTCIYMPYRRAHLLTEKSTL
jgi:hypothetical protein